MYDWLYSFMAMPFHIILNKDHKLVPKLGLSTDHTLHSFAHFMHSFYK